MLLTIRAKILNYFAFTNILIALTLVNIGFREELDYESTGGEVLDTLRLQFVSIDSPFVRDFITFASFYANAAYFMVKRNPDKGMIICIAPDYGYPLFFVILKPSKMGICEITIEVSGFEGGIIHQVGDRVVKYLVEPGSVPVYAIGTIGALGIVLVAEGLDTTSCFRAIGLVRSRSNSYVDIPVRYRWELPVTDGEHTCFLASLVVDTSICRSRLAFFSYLPLY